MRGAGCGVVFKKKEQSHVKDRPQAWEFGIVASFPSCQARQRFRHAGLVIPLCPQEDGRVAALPLQHHHHPPNHIQKHCHRHCHRHHKHSRRHQPPLPPPTTTTRSQPPPPITTTATATATVVAKRIGASARCSLRATACPKPCAGGLGMIRGSISIPFASVASQCHYDSHPPDLDLGLAGHAQ